MDPVPAFSPRDAREAALLAVLHARGGADPAHDLGHVLRVSALASVLAEREGALRAVAVAAALCHELVNLPKGHPESSRSGELCALEAAKVLREAGYTEAERAAACGAIAVHGFSRGLVPDTLEGKVLQDADRLDALGALGVARCFATCQAMGRPFYHPEDPFALRRALDDKLWGLDHFYRKLFTLAAGMHTAAGRALAAPREAFLRAFVQQLADELGHAPPPSPRSG